MASSPSYLLDTNILLALLRANPLGDSIDRKYGLRASLNRSMICVVTAGEMLSLVRKFNWGPSKQEALKDVLNQIVWIDINHADILDAYAEIDHFTSTSGLTMGKNDVWIAATAKVIKASLLTTDRDFNHLHGTHLDLIWIDPRTNETSA